ncbi:MAG: MerR family transcriptional regulator [Solirubrobacteraceae bacterium]|nr:MerR family transcriptional regulator [Solirubrobacteraceae bacterium]
MLQTAELDAARSAMRSFKTAPTSPATVSSELEEPLTISAMEMARITGVGRERLRTWERRHGFPLPVRAPNGMRRYRAEDVRAVVSIARQVDRGVALGAAIQQALQEPERGAVGFQSLGTALDYAHAPAIALQGPTPMTVAWANALTIASPEAPTVGDDLLERLPDFGPAAISAIQRLMSGDIDDSAVVTHLDWTSAFPTERQSLAWRLPAEASDQALVVLVQLPQSASHDTGVSAATPWAAAIGAARSVLEHERGVASVQHALAALVRRTGAIDGFVATSSNASELRAASSVRGCWPARAIDTSEMPDVRALLAEPSVEWLSPDTLRELSAPPRSQAVVVPLVGGGVTLGVITLFYATEMHLCEVSRELLQTFAATVAASLQRERHAALAARSQG